MKTRSGVKCRDLAINSRRVVFLFFISLITLSSSFAAEEKSSVLKPKLTKGPRTSYYQTCPMMPCNEQGDDDWVFGSFGFSAMGGGGSVNRGQQVEVTGTKRLGDDWVTVCAGSSCLDFLNSLSPEAQIGTLTDAGFSSQDAEAALTDRSVPACENERIARQGVLNALNSPAVISMQSPPPGTLIMSGSGVKDPNLNDGQPGPWEKYAVNTITRIEQPNGMIVRGVTEQHYFFNRDTGASGQLKFKNTVAQGCGAMG